MIEQELLTAIQALVGRRDSSYRELANLIAGSATGGPNGDGYYPATTADGAVRMLPCWEKVIALGGVSPPQPVNLKPALSASTILETAAVGSVVGTFALAAGQSATLVGNATGRFALNGSNLVVASSINADGGSIQTVRLRTSVAGTPNAEWDYPITITDVASSDTTPDPFSFANVNGAALSTMVESNVITPTGFDAPSPISVTTGEYRLNGGPWTNANGTINPGQTVQLRRQSSSVNSTSLSTSLSIGGVSTTWQVTTAAATAPALQELTLSQSQITVGQATTINILGATSGSALSGTVPDGLTINSSARTITGTATAAGTGGVSIVETLAGATGSPRTSTPALERVAPPPPPSPPPAFWFQAPTIAQVNAAGNALDVSISWPSGTRDSDGLWLETQAASDAAFTQPLTGETQVRHHLRMISALDLADNDAVAGPDHEPLPVLESQPNGPIFFRLRLARENLDGDGFSPVSDWSNVVSETVSVLVAAFLNPQDKSPNEITTLRNNNLTIRSAQLGFGTIFGARATQGRMGLYGFEAVARRITGTGNPGHCRVGILDTSTPINAENTYPRPGQDANGTSIVFERGELFYRDSGGFKAFNSSYTSGEGARVTVIVSTDSSHDGHYRVWYRHNGAYVGTGVQNPLTREGGYPFLISGPPMPWCAPMVTGSSTFEVDFIPDGANMLHLPAGVTPWNG
ncbi:hypothetical protein EYB45_08545 [Erythrobacteraceae bacterium CFH 75059]|uniref:hypothetical protein n=1 Tax=Qipengyuania thermophila TaxID=2509361 RepID=UPI00101E8F09|nr:hypothetical protein [Qipengyuania thermophila]TCD04285.1 hypothetical protein EYB45_08545 [Erythrobacteraceae bacterium CFH 75059]